MKTFLPLAAICAFFLPLQAQEEPDCPHARIRQNLYLHRKACAQRDAQSIPATITVETIEPEAKTLELNGTPRPGTGSCRRAAQRIRSQTFRIPHLAAR